MYHAVNVINETNANKKVVVDERFHILDNILPIIFSFPDEIIVKRAREGGACQIN